MSKDDQTPIDKAKELVNDAKDVAKIAADVATGNVVGVATTALKNKRLRKIIIWAIIISLAGQMIGFLLMMTLVIGASDMFQFPMMSFSTNQTIVETQPNGKQTTVNFLALANGWTKTIRWGFLNENKGLTSAESQQVTQLQLNLSYGLLETFYEIGIRQGAINPLKKMSYVVQQLQPSEIDFKPVTLRKVGYSKGKKYFYYVTEEVLQNITRYNGYWVTHWQIITESDGSQIVVFQPSTLQVKNYKPLYNSEQAFNVHQDTLDQQEFFGQALVLDQTFYDPNALPILQILEGGAMGGNGGPPSQGVPIPKPQIIAILQQAIQIDGVPQSWLSGLEIIVGHEDASGNPYAVDPILVDGEHASGLMQMLPSTFWGDHVAGYNDIWNPLDNAVAAIRHIEGAWRNPDKIPGVISGVYTGY
jgi:hypothetical protein